METYSVSPSGLVRDVWRNRQLIGSLSKREIAGRYRGSFIGVFWSFLTPLLMLGVFTFVFGEIFQARWGAATETGPLDFAVALFAGLLIFYFFSECVSRAPGLIIANSNFVKKVVFPLEILAIVNLGAALFHLLTGYIILLILLTLSNWNLTWYALFAPLILAPFAILVLGLTWGLAALGVYLRDIGQLVGPMLTAMMFLSPIFYPLSSVSPRLVWVYNLNPMTFVIEQMRMVMLEGIAPNFYGLFYYSLISIAVAYVGYLIFQATRKGFADVL